MGGVRVRIKATPPTKELLDLLEKQVRKSAEKVKKQESLSDKAKKQLQQDVNAYKDQRERLQRKSWEERGMAWCQECGEFHPQGNISLLYVEVEEWHGSHGYEHKEFVKEIRSFCQEHKRLYLSLSRGGEDKFQCFEAKQEKGRFFIFRSGSWDDITDLSGLKIKAERGYIPGNVYSFGVSIDYDQFRPKLVIDGKEVL